MKLTLEEFIEKNGSRKTAMDLVGNRINKLVGMSLSDLPDSSELCEIVDELESILNDYDESDMQSIKDLLKQIDMDFLYGQLLS